ncbi:MAG: beta-galactosidase [Verrucomicrobia bacterium]|nr:beta-galactosidase [Verrucomicrobiota bacterium]
MRIGTQYFRDPNPPEKFWRKDLADLASAGFSFIGCWIPWRYINPEENRWELDKYRRLLDLARRYKLGVRMQLVPESAPDWVVRRFPDARLVNERGQPVPLHAHAMLQLGGWPGINPYHPAGRSLIDDYYRQVVSHLKDHPAIHIWSLWNEIQLPMLSHDPYTQSAYRKWAQRRYGALESYNQTNGTQFVSFAELNLPNPATEGLPLLQYVADRAEFLWDMTVDEGRRRADLVRRVDPDRPVSMHTNGNSPYLGDRDDWSVAACVDVYGNSTYNRDPFYDTMSAIKQRSIKGPGKWWLTEHCGGRMVYYYGHFTFSGQDLVSDALKAMAHGAVAASFWQYRNEIVGQEAPNFGLLNHDGSRSERFTALAKLAKGLAAWDTDNLKYDPAVIGILLEPLDLAFRSASESWMNQPWQEYREFEEWLRAVLGLGHSPDFLLARQLCAKAPPKNLKLILAPSLVVLRGGLSRTLDRWVRAGGHLIAGPFTGVFDPRGRAFEKSPGDNLLKLFGLHVVSRHGGERFGFVDPETNTELLAGRHLFEEVRVQKGTCVVLKSGKHPAVLTRKVGKGTATYIAAFAGAEQAAGSALFANWLGKWLRERGVRAPISFEGPAWVNTARLGKDRIIFLHNPGKPSCEVRLRMQTGTAICDCITLEKFRSDDGRVLVPLAARQVRALATRK